MVFNLSANRARILDPIIRDLELQATPDRPEQVVSIDGRVKAPGRYPLEPKMHVSDLIRAGGSLEDCSVSRTGRDHSLSGRRWGEAPDRI